MCSVPASRWRRSRGLDPLPALFKEHLMSTSIQTVRQRCYAALVSLLLSLALPLHAFAACAAAPNNAARGQVIANGHSFTKHAAEFANGAVINGLAFPNNNITSATQFVPFVQGIMNAPSRSKTLTGGRIAYWDAATGTIVIFDPASNDCGTAFRPTAGVTYYDNQT